MGSIPNFKDVVRSRGFRATPGRVKLLEFLWREQKPFTVEGIGKKLRALDTATLYRALEAFEKAALVRRVDLGHGHAHYEVEREHHHHLVCTDCGTVEDVPGCVLASIEKKVAAQSRSFQHIHSHTLEFFGRCNTCA